MIFDDDRSTHKNRLKRTRTSERMASSGRFPTTPLLFTSSNTCGCLNVRGFWLLLLATHCCELRSLTKQFLACIYSDKWVFARAMGQSYFLIDDYYWQIFIASRSATTFHLFSSASTASESRFSLLLGVGQQSSSVHMGKRISFTAVEDNWLAFRSFFRSAIFLRLRKLMAESFKELSRSWSAINFPFHLNPLKEMSRAIEILIKLVERRKSNLIGNLSPSVNQRPCEAILKLIKAFRFQRAKPSTFHK